MTPKIVNFLRPRGKPPARESKREARKKRLPASLSRCQKSVGKRPKQSRRLAEAMEKKRRACTIFLEDERFSPVIAVNLKSRGDPDLRCQRPLAREVKIRPLLLHPPEAMKAQCGSKLFGPTSARRVQGKSVSSADVCDAKRLSVHCKKRLCCVTTLWICDDMADSAPTTIKKYANRRLYNTASSTYVTLADLAKMVKSGEDFVVLDAKTNEDITRSVLTQIIFEQEGIEGQSLLPTTFLRQLIRFYGDSMQALLPTYLEFSIDRFNGEKQAIRDAASRMFSTGAFTPPTFNVLQELTQQNLAAFHQALGIFSPFAPTAPAPQSRSPAAHPSDEIDKLRNQLSEMQKKLESLAKKN
jgi:polyhydroxyalkanoate synthesis repressor PhaR